MFKIKFFKLKGLINYCCKHKTIFMFKNAFPGVGREAGGGIGMGNTCKSMADSCHCMAKTTKKKKKKTYENVGHKNK